jgi:hypothetical protein
MARRRHKPADITPILAELTEGSDRSAGIIGAALVEDALFYAICLRIGVPYDSKGADALSVVGAPLATFENKLVFADAVGGVLTEQITRHDLTIVQAIRNTFAHDMNPRSFTDHDIRQRLKELDLAKRGANRSEPRKVYTTAIGFLTGMLIAEAQTTHLVPPLD